MALEISGSVESSHMEHPDFRLGGKVFASLGYPDEAHGMVKLNPELQASILKSAPTAFAPAAGAWGRQGSTIVNLACSSERIVRAALAAAAHNAASKPGKR